MEVMSFYGVMCEELGKKEFLHDGNKGGFPSADMVLDAIELQGLYVGVENGKIIAAYILNHDAAPAYGTVTWQIDAPKEQVSVLHALRVSPEYSGRGYAKELVKHSIEVARNKAQKAIRLDCLDENIVPQNMYLALGFQYVETVEIFYEDIGEPRAFRLFELLI